MIRATLHTFDTDYRPRLAGLRQELEMATSEPVRLELTLVPSSLLIEEKSVLSAGESEP